MPEINLGTGKEQFFKTLTAGHQQSTPVILATWEAEMGRVTF
jgi:hypothetical protein